MKAFYLQMHLHIGYKFHAHILMTSWSKNSILFAKDGGGIALREVIGNSMIDSNELLPQ